MKINSLTSMYNCTIEIAPYLVNVSFTQVNQTRVTEIRMTVMRPAGQSPEVPEPVPSFQVAEFSQITDSPDSMRLMIQSAAGHEEVQAITEVIYQAYDQVVAGYTQPTE